MKCWKNVFLLQIFFNGLIVITAQYCISFKPMMKTRVQWNNGQRLISKRNFFGVIKYKYEPYVYSTMQVKFQFCKRISYETSSALLL